MARAYNLKRRAEQQAETRLRIVEATVDLHTEIGPAQTTISMVAERAGVQRHTVYAHFPKERDLLLACSGLSLERDPLPDIEAWKAIPDSADRLRFGLSQLYSWFERNAELAASILRDAEFHVLTKEVVEMRLGQPMERLAEALGAGMPASPRLRAAVKLAISFFTWRELTREGGLTLAEAVELMTRAVTCVVA